MEPPKIVRPSKNTEKAAASPLLKQSKNHSPLETEKTLDERIEEQEGSDNNDENNKEPWDEEPEAEHSVAAFDNSDPSSIEITSVLSEDGLVSSSLPTRSRMDPLQSYLREIHRTRLLEPEEELQLAIELKETGSLNAAKALVRANLRLVVKIAFEYRRFYSNVFDLIQEGNIGLMKAVSKYDSEKGVRLGYYASWWIRSYILKFLLENFRLVRIGTTQAQKKLFYHLSKEKEKLEAQGITAGPKLLASKLDVREKDVIEMEKRLSGHGSELSIDNRVDPFDAKTPSFKDSLVDPMEDQSEVLAREELLQRLELKLPELVSMLNDKELRILERRILAEDPRTLQEVADEYGLTRERVRQIETKVVQKFKSLLAADFGLTEHPTSPLQLEDKRGIRKSN